MATREFLYFKYQMDIKILNVLKLLGAYFYSILIDANKTI